MQHGKDAQMKRRRSGLGLVACGDSTIESFVCITAYASGSLLFFPFYFLFFNNTMPCSSLFFYTKRLNPVTATALLPTDYYTAATDLFR